MVFNAETAESAEQNKHVFFSLGVLRVLCVKLFSDS
jgi:hypothetical protein